MNTARGLFLLLTAATLGHARATGPTYSRVYTLGPKEGVFAYARIAPDGRTLVYASELNEGRRRVAGEPVITVVDVASKRISFAAPGTDAYWSVDGTRLIYTAAGGVSIRDMRTGKIKRHIAPNGLGDYYSWGLRDGKDLILTIDGNYYYLQNDKAVLPIAKVKPCDPIGAGQRPLISKDGRRITTFVDGNIVVRGLDNCADIFNSGIKGAKADFSWDGRFIAFHSLKQGGDGYDIQIVDLQKKTIRTLPGLRGSGLFPSWTKDGRLCFRYDGPDYRGFVIAANVLDALERPLPSVPVSLRPGRRWTDIFPETSRPDTHLSVVMIWAPWSAHSQSAFAELDRLRSFLADGKASVSVAAAADPESAAPEVARQLTWFGTSVPSIPLGRAGLAQTEARNQMPATLLFRDGTLIGAKLGAQSFEALKGWIRDAGGLGAVLGEGSAGREYVR